MTHTVEVDVDVICDGKCVLIGSIMEYIEHRQMCILVTPRVLC